MLRIKRHEDNLKPFLQKNFPKNLRMLSAVGKSTGEAGEWRILSLSMNFFRCHSKEHFRCLKFLSRIPVSLFVHGFMVLHGHSA